MKQKVEKPKNKNEKLKKERRKIQKQEGITLIALVITIIVLIILAMVTIAMLTGPNGLLNKAVEARIANDKGEIQDRAETEVLASIGNNGQIDWEELKENLATNFEIDEESINEKEEEDIVLSFIVEKNGRNYEVDIDGRGKVTVKYEGETSEGEGGSTIRISHEIKVEKLGSNISTPSGGEIKTDGNGEKFPIPSGFTYQEGNVADGAVVKANADESEFVWVPVKKAVAESEETAIQKEKTVKIIIKAEPKSRIKNITNETESNIEKISNTEYKVTKNGEYKFKITPRSGEIQEYAVNVEEIEEGAEEKAMAVKDPTDGTNYRGIFYNFSEAGSTVMDGCTTNDGTSSPYYHEPAYLTSSDYGDENSSANNGRVTEAGLKSEYKEMIESVKKYGGFYVGRYETSLNANKAQSKKDQESMSAATTSGNTWWGMYEKEKNYASDAGISSVGSSMIWGSQYDAMMNWMLKGSDANKVYSSSAKHSKAATGSTEDDKMNRIYDLGNNLYEWTLEANNIGNRIMRGSNFYNTSKASYRNYSNPTKTDDSTGSRLTLYIK